MFRIKDKENIYLNSRQVTSYKIFEKIPSDSGFMLLGSGYCDGWDKNDQECISDWLDSEECE